MEAKIISSKNRKPQAKKVSQYITDFIKNNPDQENNIDQCEGNKRLLDLLIEFEQVIQVEEKLSDGTIAKHLYQVQNIIDFLKTSKRIDIRLKDIRLRLMEELRHFLMKEKKSSMGHASRHLTFCKRAMRYAVVMEYLSINPISDVIAKKDKIKEVSSLEINEIEKIRNYNGPITYMNVRDLFLFQCFTGLSFGDLRTFDLVEKSGRVWIENKRSKNNNAYHVPLFENAKEILDSYEGKLPDVWLQTYNRCIKKIASFIGVKKNLSSHTGRKTFATLKNDEGWSLKSIQEMLGQKSASVCEKHYLRLTTNRIENEMLRLNISQ